MIYKGICLALVLLLAIMCGTTEQQDTKQKAWFIKICNHTGDSCQVYLPTKNITIENFDTKAFIDSNENVFLAKKM